MLQLAKWDHSLVPYIMSYIYKLHDECYSLLPVSGQKYFLPLFRNFLSSSPKMLNSNWIKYLYIFHLNQDDNYVHIAPHLITEKVSLTFCTHSFQFLNWTSSWIRLTNRAPNTRMNVESTPFFTFLCICHKKFCSNSRNPLTFDGNAFSLSTAAEKKFDKFEILKSWCIIQKSEFRVSLFYNHTIFYDFETCSSKTLENIFNYLSMILPQSNSI